MKIEVPITAENDTEQVVIQVLTQLNMTWDFICLDRVDEALKVVFTNVRPKP